jgi:HEAT repeat protein
MSTDSDTSMNPGTDAPKRARRLQTGVRTLIALVGCCAIVLWSWRHLSENYDAVRREARSIQERASSALRSGRPAERLAAIVELQGLGLEDGSIAIPPLIRALDDPETQVRVASAEALRSVGPGVAKSRSGGGTIRDAATALIRCLKSADVKVRSQAALLLGMLRAGAAAPELLRALNEPLAPGVGPFHESDRILDPGCAAAWALGRIAPGSVEAKRVIAALTEVARFGPVIRRGWAASALGEFGPAAEEAVPVLIKVIKESTPEPPTENEAMAAEALGKIAPDTPSADQAVAALLPVLESKDESTRIRAIEAIGRFGPRAGAAIPKIRALKGDSDHSVRDAAAKSLSAIDTASAP